MADDKKPEVHDAMKDVYYLLAIFAVLVAVWWMVGGPNMADLRGMFMNPLPPVGTGDAYGPTIPPTPVEYTEPTGSSETTP